jgi:hypothetical protein
LENKVSEFDFGPDGKVIAIGDYKGQVRVFDLESGMSLFLFSQAMARITGVKFIN